MSTYVDLISRLRGKVNDSSEVSFTDEELTAEINEAIIRFNPSYTIDTLPEADEYLVVKLAASQTAFAMASKYASKFALNVEGLSINKAKVFDNWMRLGKTLFDSYSADMQEKGFTIEVDDMARYCVSRNMAVNKR